MDVMITVDEVLNVLAGNVRNRRLFLNWTQKTLAERSGVSLGVIKKFEGVGKISLESLLKIALVLDCLGNFKSLFVQQDTIYPKTLDELLDDKSRKRGRL